MKIVFAHTDFRIYWPARLTALHEFLNNKGIKLFVVEIAGAGSPYSFAGESCTDLSYWHCIFPGQKMEEIAPRKANRALRRKLDELQPDIVFSGSIAFPSGAASARWANENGRKCIMFDNARLIDVPRKWYINFIKKQIYSLVSAVFCPSPEWNTTFHYFGFKDKQIFHGLNAIDNSYWMNNDNNISNKLSESYFLSVGRQILKKNFLTLLKAYKRYSNLSKYPAELILVGEGYRRKVLEEFVNKSGLKKVTFLPFASQEELKGLYKNALCFILPSRNGETWGNVVNEAMASGLPVLVSDKVGCSSTLVKEGINGFTFSPENPETLSELLLKIEQMPQDKRKEMGRNSKTIIKDWGLERFCSGVEEAIRFVINSHHKKPSIIKRWFVILWKGRYRPV